MIEENNALRLLLSMLKQNLAMLNNTVERLEKEIESVKKYRDGTPISKIFASTHGNVEATRLLSVIERHLKVETAEELASKHTLASLRKFKGMSEDRILLLRELLAKFGIAIRP
jgi:hemerythrin-like domain-containing protein